MYIITPLVRMFIRMLISYNNRRWKLKQQRKDDA